MNLDIVQYVNIWVDRLLARLSSLNDTMSINFPAAARKDVQWRRTNEPHEVRVRDGAW